MISLADVNEKGIRGYSQQEAPALNLSPVPAAMVNTAAELVAEALASGRRHPPMCRHPHRRQSLSPTRRQAHARAPLPSLPT
jgi:hypothetical protein